MCLFFFLSSSVRWSMLGCLMKSLSVVMGKVCLTISVPSFQISIPNSTGNVIGLMLTPSIQSTYSSCEEFIVRKEFICMSSTYKTIWAVLNFSL